jgi:hypothetical protein
VIAQLWEWSVLRPQHVRNSPVGVCRTAPAAMQALSKALIAAGRPARGQVVPAVLVRPVHKDASYERGAPERTAIYDGTVIVWI